MQIIRSTPNELGFFKTMQEWMDEQESRLWLVTPFIDKIGIGLINSSGGAKSCRLICRRNKELPKIKSLIKIKMHENVHVKLFVGDDSSFFGSVNLTQNSLTNNLEMMLKFKEKDITDKLARYFEVLWI